LDFPEIARRLRRQGAPITPALAAALGDREAIRELYARDAKAFREGWWSEPNPLSMAVMFGQPEAVRQLLDLGLDPDERMRVPHMEEEIFSRGGPLWLAAAFGEHEMARLLLERGADPNAVSHASGAPMDRAYARRDENMKALLRAHGGRPSPGTLGLNREAEEARRFLEEERSEEEIRELLWAGACGGSVEIVEMTLPLLKWPADHQGWHAIMVQPLRVFLHSPVSEHPEWFDRSTYPECLRLILARGMDINLAGRNGYTLMHDIAAEGKCWGIVVMTEEERVAFARVALERGPDLARRDNLLKSTPLAWACRWGRRELVKVLLEYGAPAEEPEAEEWATPLAWARKMGQGEIEEALRRYGAKR